MAIDWEWVRQRVNEAWDQNSLWGPLASSDNTLLGEGYGMGTQWPGLESGNDLLLGMNNPDSSIGDLAASQSLEGLTKKKKLGFHYSYNIGNLMSGKSGMSQSGF